jgi:hypothetical protein
MSREQHTTGEDRMRDGTVGGNGFGTASDPDNAGWDEGLYRDDARSYAPGAGNARP